MKNLLILLAMTFALAPVALAQGGCVNSPENPTAVLALVGAGAMAWRMRRLK